jgi:hypothetical protein
VIRIIVGRILIKFQSFHRVFIVRPGGGFHFLHQSSSYKIHYVQQLPNAVFSNVFLNSFSSHFSLLDQRKVTKENQDAAKHPTA